MLLLPRRFSRSACRAARFMCTALCEVHHPTALALAPRFGCCFLLLPKLFAWLVPVHLPPLCSRH